ncbi:MAG: dNTP triphosphohydrolase [Sedimentisphaerales bacterium]|nr:dNTP triphosphohydrolase [Sedimentisphaerales bacterium]
MTERVSFFAVTEASSKGRRFNEPEHAYRSAFERDRDRIIHTSAFRRLEGKTQVFMPQTNDHYRTRLTHSIEVAQIGRTIAKSFDLNEALTEAVCLGHDLGHSPFGHSGEAALDKLMKDYGGFEHNAQTLRIVDVLEKPYPDFAGLNLMYETRLALAKHRTVYDTPKSDTFTEKNCSLEGQIADLADRIAYNCHDLEDGLRANLLDYEKVVTVGLCSGAAKRCQAEKISNSLIRNTRIAKTIIDMLVGDCIEASRAAIDSADINDLKQVLNSDKNFIVLSSAADGALGELEEFLHQSMYEHEAVKAGSAQSAGWLGKIFKKFCKKPELMPDYYQNLVSEFGLERTVCDYIAGMTDWYCLEMLNT